MRYEIYNYKTGDTAGVSFPTKQQAQDWIARRKAETSLRLYWRVRKVKSNPRGGRTMARRTTRKSNARAADRWGVYVKSQLAYVSTKRLDANKAASRLRLSGRANISIKPVGPNPISGIVPKVGWRAEFKKAAYSAMKAPGVRRKRARTTSKIRQTRQRRGENPRRSNPSFTEWIVEGKTFYSLSGDKRSEAIAYAKRLADERGTNVQLTTIKGYAQRDPSGFIYDSTEDSETTITVRPKRRRNAAGPSSRAVAGRIGRAVGARVKSRNPGGSNWKWRLVGPDGKTYKSYYFGGDYGGTKAEAQRTADIINRQGGRIGSEKVRVKGRGKSNPRRAGVGTRSVMRGGTFRGAVGRKRNAPSILRRRNASRTKSRATTANPSSGYVVQVGNTVAWVGKLAADAQKAMRKLMAGGRKGVKGFAAKLPVGIKRGWRSQFKAVSRKRNASFGKGKLGSGSRFKSCVRTMKRRGVASPGGLCASIGRRKYGAKRMAGMAKRGRARRSNPPKFYRIAYTMPSGKRHAGLISANSIADATQYYKRVMLREFPDGRGGTKASRLTIRRAKGTEIPKVYR